jgi:hypothetical protein
MRAQMRGTIEKEDLEDERERYILGIFLKVIWSSLIILFVFGALSLLTVFLEWWKYLLFCLLGLLAGISISVAILGSSRNRDLITLILGAVILPIMAAYLGTVAVRNQAAFSTYSAILFPFFAYATGAILSGLLIAKIWQKRPVRPRLGEEEEEFPEAKGITTPIKEPPAQPDRETIEQATKAEEVKV